MAGKSRKSQPAAPLAQRKAAGAEDSSDLSSGRFEGAGDLSVDDFIDAHLKERPNSKAPAKRDAATSRPHNRVAVPDATSPKKISRDQVYKPAKTPGNWSDPPQDEKPEAPRVDKQTPKLDKAPPSSNATRPMLGLKRTPIPREDPNSLAPRGRTPERRTAPEAKPLTPKVPNAPIVTTKLLPPEEGSAPVRRTASIRAAANEERISHLEDEIEQLRWDLRQARDSAAELFALATNAGKLATATPEAKDESPAPAEKPPEPRAMEPSGEDFVSALIAETIEPTQTAEPTEINELADAVEPLLLVEETPDPAAHTPPKPEAKGTRRRSPVVPVAAAAVALVLLLVAASSFLQPGAEEPDPIVVSVAGPSRPPTEAPAADEPEADAPKPDAPKPDAPKTDEPVTEGGGDPSEAKPAGDAPIGEEVLVDETDGTALLSYQGYLTVRSSDSLDVYVQGKRVGKTNQKLTARCGPRNVRIAEAGPKWLSAGRHVRIKCMAATTVSIDPTP